MKTPPDSSLPVLGFAAFSGTGKTTLLTKLLPLLRAQGLRVGLVKHAHHGFDIDHPGKDSHELRLAGASPVLIASSVRRAMITERPTPRDPVLAEELACFGSVDVDLILVEGFKRERFPKIELYRPALGHPLLFPQDHTIIAIATDAPLPARPPIPTLDLNRPDEIAAFILQDFLRRP
jgi:molybdopterin-guanine dinucleotide biosynthesis protein B